MQISHFKIFLSCTCFPLKASLCLSLSQYINHSFKTLSPIKYENYLLIPVRLSDVIFQMLANCAKVNFFFGGGDFYFRDCAITWKLYRPPKERRTDSSTHAINFLVSTSGGYIIEGSPSHPVQNLCTRWWLQGLCRFFLPAFLLLQCNHGLGKLFFFHTFFFLFSFEMIIEVLLIFVDMF